MGLDINAGLSRYECDYCGTANSPRSDGLWVEYRRLTERECWEINPVALGFKGEVCCPECGSDIILPFANERAFIRNIMAAKDLTFAVTGNPMDWAKDADPYHSPLPIEEPDGSGAAISLPLTRLADALTMIPDLEGDMGERLHTLYCTLQPVWGLYEPDDRLAEPDIDLPLSGYPIGYDRLLNMVRGSLERVDRDGDPVAFRFPSTYELAAILLSRVFDGRRTPGAWDTLHMSEILNRLMAVDDDDPTDAMWVVRRDRVERFTLNLNTMCAIDSRFQSMFEDEWAVI